MDKRSTCQSQVTKMAPFITALDAFVLSELVVFKQQMVANGRDPKNGVHILAAMCDWCDEHGVNANAIQAEADRVTDLDTGPAYCWRILAKTIYKRYGGTNDDS